MILVANILDIIQDGGEDLLIKCLSDFSCPKNDEIEVFIKSKAVEFAKKKMAITYIAFDSDDGQILGYFTLAHKALEITSQGMSKTTIKKVSRYSEHDELNDTYTVSAFLLAQFGKNYSVENGQKIDGKELMLQVEQVLHVVQHQIGGSIVYLDAEDDNEFLLSFYEASAFRQFNKRVSKTDGKTYQQMIRFL